MDEIVQQFKEEHKVPFPTAVHIDTIDAVPRACRVHWSVNNFERVESVQFATSCLIDYDGDSKQIATIHELPGITEMSNE